MVDIVRPDKAYLDTNLIREWFVRIMRGEREVPKIIEFLSEHNEFEKYISLFTIAELIETLYKERRIKDHMKKKY